MISLLLHVSWPPQTLIHFSLPPPIPLYPLPFLFSSVYTIPSIPRLLTSPPTLPPPTHHPSLLPPYTQYHPYLLISPSTTLLLPSSSYNTIQNTILTSFPNMHTTHTVNPTDTAPSPLAYLLPLGLLAGTVLMLIVITVAVVLTRLHITKHQHIYEDVTPGKCFKRKLQSLSGHNLCELHACTWLARSLYTILEFQCHSLLCSYTHFHHLFVNYREGDHTS